MAANSGVNSTTKHPGVHYTTWRSSFRSSHRPFTYSLTPIFDHDVMTSNSSLDDVSNRSGSVIDDDDDITSIDDYLWIYFSPLILIFGLCGNILTLAVMRRKGLRGTTTSVYLPVMAVFDTIALLFGIIPEWFKASGIVIFRELHPAACKFEKFVFYTTSDTAIWILVLFTVDRFVAVCFPLHKSHICVPRRSKIGCAVVFACSVVKNLHVFWTRGAEFNAEGRLATNCGRPDPGSAVFEMRYRPWVALTLISIVPFCILLTCNCVIIWKLTSAKRVQMRRPHMSSAAAAAAVNVATASAVASTEATSRSRYARTFKQTTMMCLSASFVFLVCVIPSIVLLIGKPYWTVRPNFAYDVAKAVTNQLAYFNHSVNFFLYCFTGQKFRSELVSMLVQVRQSMVLHHTDTTGFRTSHTVISTPSPQGANKISLQVVDPLRMGSNTRGNQGHFV